MGRVDDPFAVAAAVWIIIMSIIMFIIIMRLPRLTEHPTVLRRWSRRMLMTVSVWMISIGVFLLALDAQWTSTIALFGVGAVMLVAVWRGWLTQP